MTPTAARRFVDLMGEARLVRGAGYIEPAVYKRPEPFFIGKEAFIIRELFQGVWSPYQPGSPAWNTQSPWCPYRMPGPAGCGGEAVMNYILVDENGRPSRCPSIQKMQTATR